MRNRNPIFTMPPQQSPAAGVEGMILVDAEDHRRTRRKLEEMQMRVAELSGKVDTLIQLATQFKDASQSQPAASIPPDDPEVEALGHRIDDAIAVLQGTKTATEPNTGVSGGIATGTVDPNAPV